MPRLVFCVWLGTALRSDFEDSAALRAELEDAVLCLISVLGFGFKVLGFGIRV